MKHEQITPYSYSNKTLYNFLSNENRHKELKVVKHNKRNIPLDCKSLLWNHIHSILNPVPTLEEEEEEEEL